jgi:hypothetical protein
MRHVGVRGSEAGLLADEDDGDAAGQFLADPEDLPGLAVLPVNHHDLVRLLHLPGGKAGHSPPPGRKCQRRIDKGERA